MRPSRKTFATIEAAAIESESASPPMMARAHAGEHRQIIAVDQGDAGATRKSEDRPTHGEQARLTNVDPVDLGGAHDRDPDLGAAEDLLEQSGSLLGRECLRIVDAFGHAARVEDDRGGDHGPGKRAPPHLVDAGHELVALPQHRLFEVAGRSHRTSSARRPLLADSRGWRMKKGCGPRVKASAGHSSEFARTSHAGRSAESAG